MEPPGKPECRPPWPACPRCGEPAARAALGGLCPSCLVRVSLRSLAEDPLGGAAGTPTAPGPATRWRNYELLEQIGRGGMGVVWRARQISLNRIVAVKTMRESETDDPERRARFRFEAEAAGMLQHPHIVPVYEVGEADGRPFFAMRLLEGGTLADQLEAGVWSGSHCPAHRRSSWVRWWWPHPACCPRAVALTAQLARAVHYAHQRGVLHRDLKPGNILLDEGGQPLIADFGLAGWLDGTGPGIGQSGNEVLGTPAYLAPERTTQGGRVTTAADVYSLGAILYHLLTGRPPFLAESRTEVIRLAREARPTPPRALNPRIDRDLEAVCLRCLSRDPAARYASAANLADDLERWHRGEDVQARVAPPLERLLRRGRRRPAVAALGLLAAVLAGTGITGVLFESRRAARHASATQAALERLWEATPALARSHQLSPHTGSRAESLDAIATAARLRPSTALRNEAVAALARLDLVPGTPSHPMPPGAYRVFQGPDLGTLALPLSDPPRWRFERMADGAEVAVFEVPVTAGEGPRYSGDGRRAAFRSAPRENGASDLQVWDLATRRVLLREPVRGDAGFDLAPDGAAVAFQGPEGDLAMAALAPPSPPRRLLSRTSPGLLRFARDGRLAFLTAGEVLLLDPAANRVLERRALGLSIVCADWSPDGTRLALGCLNREVRIWTPGGDTTETVGAHDGLVHHVEFGPAGDLLVSNGYDGSSRFWEMPSGRLLAFTQEGYAQQFDPTGGRIGWFRTRQSFGTWEVSRSPVYRTLRLPGYPVPTLHSADFDRTARRLLVAADSGVHLLDCSDSRVLASVALPGTRAARWWPPGENAVLVAGESGLARVELRPPPGSGVPQWNKPQPLEVPGLRALVDLWVSADGTVAAVASTEEVWSLRLKEGPPLLPKRLGAVPARARHVRLSDNGRWAVVSPDYQMGSVVFDTTGLLPQRIMQPSALSRGGFDRHGNRLAEACFDAVRIMETENWRVLRTWRRDAASDLPGLVTFSPDDRLLAWTPNLRQIRLSEAETGTEWVTLSAPDRRVPTEILFGAGGRMMAALTVDQVIQLWDLDHLRRELERLGLGTDGSGIPAPPPRASVGKKVGDVP